MNINMYFDHTSFCSS